MPFQGWTISDKFQALHRLRRLRLANFCRASGAG